MLKNLLTLSACKVKLSSMDTKLELKHGDITKIARAAGVTPQAAWQWFRSGKVPVKHLATTCKVLGVSADILRPDLFQLLKESKSEEAS